MFGLVLNSLNKSRYEKLAIGYEFVPGALTTETCSHEASPFGRVCDAAATAALVESSVGYTKLPA